VHHSSCRSFCPNNASANANPGVPLGMLLSNIEALPAKLSQLS
jgi:hypothetical protein